MKRLRNSFSSSSSSSSTISSFSSPPYPFHQCSSPFWSCVPIDLWKYEILPFLCESPSDFKAFRSTSVLFFLLSIQYSPSLLTPSSSSSSSLLFYDSPSFINDWTEKRCICRLLTLSDSSICYIPYRWDKFLHHFSFWKFELKVNNNDNSLSSKLEKTYLFSKRSILDFVDHTNQIYAVASLCGRTRLVSGSEDKTVKIWNVDTAKCIKTLE